MVAFIYMCTYLCSIPLGSLIPPPPTVNGGILATNNCTLLEYNCPGIAFGAMSGTLQYNCTSGNWSTDLTSCSGMLYSYMWCISNYDLVPLVTWQVVSW